MAGINEREEEKGFDPTSFFTSQQNGEQGAAHSVKGEDPGTKEKASGEEEIPLSKVEEQVMPPSMPVPSAPQALTPVSIPAGEVNFESRAAINIGDKIQRYPIDKFRGIKGFIRRIAVLSITRWYAIKEHFENDVGSYYCFEGSCCDYAEPKVRYLAPILVYDTDKEGNIVSAKFEVEYISLSETYYDSFLLMHRAHPLDKVDVLVSCEDEHYQKLAFQPVGGASWITNESFKKQVMERYVRLERHILRRHARKLGNTNEEAAIAYKKIKGNNNHTLVPSGVKFDLSQFLT